MTIKNKLNLITVIVVSFALVIIALTVNIALKEDTIVQQSKVLNIMSQKLSLLIHETQKERGTSAGYLGSKGKKFAPGMYAKFITLVVQQDAYMDAFITMATQKKSKRR